MNFFQHFFTPRHTNNQRAKLLHNSSLFIIACLLLVGSFALHYTKTNYQQVLGVSVNISSQDLLTLTNEARASAGLVPLSLNSELANAAAGKAEDMFTNNYWAHISPSGVTPWDFIRGAGYNYSYAGENLARGYDSAKDAMNAWMTSPEHKANILSPNYTDVGFAVSEGTLTGDPNTVLIVEEFGKPVAAQPAQIPVVQQAAAAQNVVVQTTPVPSITPSPTQTIQPTITVMPQVLTQVTQKPLIDSKKATQAIGITLLLIFILVFLLDMLIIGRRRLFRIVGHNMDHIIFFLTIIALILLLGQGASL